MAPAAHRLCGDDRDHWPTTAAHWSAVVPRMRAVAHSRLSCALMCRVSSDRLGASLSSPAADAMILLLNPRAAHFSVPIGRCTPGLMPESRSQRF